MLETERIRRGASRFLFLTEEQAGFIMFLCRINTNTFCEKVKELLKYCCVAFIPMVQYNRKNDDIYSIILFFANILSFCFRV